jgi:ATP-dependent Clp protease ATP-binding subunit ClpC
MLGWLVVEPNDDAWEVLMELMLSDRSQHVMGLARDEALRLHHEYVGTEHVLLGIVSESADVTAGALGSFSITLDRARSGVETMIGLGPPSASPDHRGVTPRAQQAIEFAREEAVHRNSPQVEPEHLLLGVAREAHGVAAQVLRDLLAPPEAVRAKVSELLGRGN